MHIIAGLYRQKRLITPKGNQTRPTASRLRESLFNICQQYIEDSRFLDLFAGSGAMGLEALSRGAQSATFIDSHKEAIRCIQQNVDFLQVRKQTQVLYGDVFRLLKTLEQKNLVFDIIFADPPYRTSDSPGGPTYSEKLIKELDASSLLATNGMLFIEEASDIQWEISSLNQLELKSSRRIGDTILYQYQRVS